MVEVNCETDFVGKTEEFQSFVKKVAHHVLQNKPKDRDALVAQTWANSGKSVEEITREMVAKIGENISIRRFHQMAGKADEFIGQYIHMGSKIGALVLIKGSKLPDEALRGVAMHVAAAAPRFVSADRIPQDILDKEKEIYLEQMKDSGKPAEILGKIIDGKIKKFATEVCVDDQIYIKDPEGKLSVSKYLKSLDPQAKILEFVRFQVGEGLEKKQENFAEEVAKQMGK
jgi:elongation factor Ts